MSSVDSVCGATMKGASVFALAALLLAATIAETGVCSIRLLPMYNDEIQLCSAFERLDVPGSSASQI